MNGRHKKTLEAVFRKPMKNVMEYKGYQARVDFDADDGIFVGHIAGINDVIGFHGTSVAEMKAAFAEAVDDYLATCSAIGKKPERPYSGKVMLRFSPDVHASAAIRAELEGKSLNQWAEEVIALAASWPGKTADKKAISGRPKSGTGRSPTAKATQRQLKRA
jgi:predicted HicB family RNase H-like nuclease